MTNNFPHLLSLLLLLPLLPLSSTAQANGNISLGQSLATNENTSPWLLPSGEFAFGFLPLGNTDAFLLAIWCHKIPENTIVFGMQMEINRHQEGQKFILPSMASLSSKTLKMKWYGKLNLTMVGSPTVWCVGMSIKLGPLTTSLKD